MKFTTNNRFNMKPNLPPDNATTPVWAFTRVRGLHASDAVALPDGAHPDVPGRVS